MKKLLTIAFCFLAYISLISGEPLLHPKYPIISGKYKITKEWSIDLPGKFNKRFEDDSLVIWKPRFTMWIIVWNNNKNLNPFDQLEIVRQSKSNKAYDLIEIREPNTYRYGYKLDEWREEEKRTVYAFYGYVSGRDGYTQIAFYYDNKADFEIAKKIWLSIEEQQ